MKSLVRFRRIIALFVLLICLFSTGCAEYADTDSSGAGQSETKAVTVDAVPDYAGSPYVRLNGNQPEFTDEEKQNTDAFESYSELDSLGRCGTAYANICKELMPTGEREAIGQVKPSGWHTVKYVDVIEDNYLYNRCHLIGYQLAGENANEKNLITGTRYFNTEGMLPFENMVADYVKATENHVLYRVTPIFEGDDLVASGVEMEAWSVEDAGKGVCFHVYCYNVQPGIGIDYADGSSWETGEDPADIANNAVGTRTALSANGRQTKFVLNTNTKKFHLPSCSGVDDMAKKNKRIVWGTVEELEEEGYVPCAKCLGEYR